MLFVVLVPRTQSCGGLLPGPPLQLRLLCSRPCRALKTTARLMGLALPHTIFQGSATGMKQNKSSPGRYSQWWKQPAMNRRTRDLSFVLMGIVNFL
jgi:hypothetical protein